MSLPSYSTLDDLIDHYANRLDKESINRDRIKKFYNDDESFDTFMSRIINKDAERFEKLLDDDQIPNPWRVLYVVLDIVQHEGEEVPPFDTLTRSLLSKTLIYHGWTFSWVHGENTLISIFNRKDELVYRF